ncbi:MAG: ABC-F family ATP-binding cassette domain-containing protein [Oligoflexia bacterium]|nr:ABC-F family ATP-binding cassette domain-containing protein [Oligoflexia bacterium]
MLQAFDLAKSFGSNLIFENVNFAINDGERIGLVGRNGHGKTTLFRTLIGEELSDQGKIVTSKNYSIGYLSQKISISEKSVVEEGCLGLPEGERDASYKVEKVLSGLGFTKEDFAKDPRTLSGGYQVRLNLAKLLVSDAKLLLLDEPTNYLDILSLRWLASFLRSWQSEVMLITHDRGFMDSVVTHILGIHRKRVRKIPGKTADYFAKIAQEEEIYEKTRVNEEKRVSEIEEFVNKFRAKARQGALAQSRLKMLSKIDVKDKLEKLHDLDFSFTYAPFTGKLPLQVKSLSFCYDKDKRGVQLPLIQNVSFYIGHEDRVAIIGKNGKGKTTLLNLLAGKMSADSGSIELHTNAKLAYFEQTNRDSLLPQLSIEEEIRQSNPGMAYTQVRGICGTMMFSGDDAKKKIAVLSGGEKSRVLLGKILATPCNLLFLDEPTNHLDMESSEALLNGLDDFPGTVLIVTHNELLLRRLPNKLIVFQKNGVEFFDGTYEEFLEKGGYDEEEKEGEQKEGGNSSGSGSENGEELLDSKTYKFIRQQIIKERSAILVPLRERVEKLEQKIIALEEEQKEINAELMNPSDQGGAKIAKLSIRHGEIEKELHSFYAVFDEESNQLVIREEEFQQKLAELEARFKNR